jgi:AP-1 complex subunit gamma-1
MMDEYTSSNNVEI